MSPLYPFPYLIIMGLYILFESLLISLGVLARASSISNSMESFNSRSATDLSAPIRTATLTMYL